MWRTSAERAESAARRLILAADLWQWVPHPFQRSLFCAASQVTVAACGRRWGKTECLSMDIASLALDELAHGRECRQLVVAPSDNQARLIGGETLRLLLKASDEKAPIFDGVHLSVRQRPALSLTLSSVAYPTVIVSILCRTAGRDGRSLRGLFAHRIIGDEAAYIPDSVLNEVLMPMLLDKGGDYLLASSPVGKRSAYYRLFAKAVSGAEDGHGITYSAHQFPTLGNPHLDLAYLHSQREEMGETMFAQEYEAQFLDMGGAVFREEDIEAAIQADDRVTSEPKTGFLLSEPVAGRRYVVGVDWGRKLDFTVVCILDCTDTPARLVGLWRWQGTSWEAQIALVSELVAKFDPWKVLGDGSGIGDALADRLQAGIRAAVVEGTRVPPFEVFLFTGDSKQQLVDRLNLRLSARRVAFPSHRVLLGELRGFEYLGSAGPSRRNRTGARGSGHDDVVMALALAVWVCPEAAVVGLGERLLLGSQMGGVKRAA